YDGTSGTADFWGSGGNSVNTAYFDYVDALMDLAQQRGFLLIVYELPWGYAGGGDQGWWPDLVNVANTQAKSQAFGQWLGTRYRNRSNILWLHGSDFDGDTVPRAPDATSGIQRGLAITQGMIAAGAA